MKQQIDELVKRLQEKEYSYDSHSGGKHTTTVLSKYQPNTETALRQVVSEWLEEFYQYEFVEMQSLKTKLSIYEEIVKKSNFAPMLIEPPKE